MHRIGLETPGGAGDFGLPSKTHTGRWEILRNSFKPFPCGIVIHPILDGCVQLHGELASQDIKITEIDRVDLIVHPLVLELTGKTKPRDGLQAKFSVYHSAAIALLYGKGTPAQFEDTVVQDSHVISIRDKVKALVSDSLRADEARIMITLQDRRTTEKHVEHAIGSKEVPLTEAQLEEKFKNQCESILGEKLDRVSKALWDVESAVDIRDVIKIAE